MKTKSGVFSFEGRIGIEEYWGNVAVSVIIGIGISLMANTRLACFASLLLPCYLWYVLAFMSKRCHDRGNPGSYILIPFYPLVLAFGEGDAGDNEYGPNMDETVKSAEQGFAKAQYNLGICYHDGRGVPRDEVEAVNWYRKAAEQRFAPAQINLGICYFNGEGVEKDSMQAVSWFRKAAEQGAAEAQFYLGICYHDGKGVAKDGVETYAHWNLASLTHQPAREKLIILKKQMTDDQIATGQKRTNELQKEIDAKIAAKKAEDDKKAGK